MEERIGFHEWIRKKLAAAGMPEEKIVGETGHLQGALIHLLPPGKIPIDFSKETHLISELELHFGEALRGYIDVTAKAGVYFDKRPASTKTTAESRGLLTDKSTTSKKQKPSKN